MKFWLFLFWGVSFGFAAPSGHDAWRSAGCFIKLDGVLGPKMIFVEDVWSKKLSFPGGLREYKETPPETAKRESWEETGLTMDIGEQILIIRKFHLHQCVPQTQPVEFFWFDAPELNIHELRRPTAAHSRLEIRKVVLASPEEVAPLQLRFETQRENLKQLFASQPTAGTYTVVDQSTLTSTIGDRPPRGLEFIERLQKACDSSACHSVFRGLTSLADESFFYITIPLFWLVTPWQQGAELLGLVLFSSFSNDMLKHYFQRPRPFEFDSKLQLTPASGYSFPSGHAQGSLVFFGALFLILTPLLSGWSRGLTGMLFLFLALGCGISRNVLGVHFFEDVQGGWAMGALCLAVYAWARQKFLKQGSYQFKSLGWVLGIFVVLGAGIILNPHPATITISSIALFTALGIWLGRQRRRAFFAIPRSKTMVFLQYCLSVAVVFGLNSFFRNVLSFENTGYAMILQRICLCASLGLWVSWGQYLLFARMGFRRGS